MNGIEMNMQNLSDSQNGKMKSVQSGGHKHKAHHERMMDRTDNYDKKVMERSIKTSLGNNIDMNL